MSAELPVQGVGRPAVAAPLACRPAGDGRRAAWPAAPATPPASSRRSPRRRRRRGASAGRRDHRHRRGQGRPHPAAVGRRQCRHRRPGDAQRRRNGARRVQRSQYPAPGEGRRRHRRRGAAGAQQALDEGAEIILGPLFAQSVSVVGQVARAAQRAGDRVLDRRQCRLARRLSAELPAGIRRRRASCNMPPRPGSAPTPRSSPTIRTAPWSKRRSSRMSRAAAARSSRSNAIRTTRPAWPAPVKNVAQAAARADALFIPDGGDAVPDVVQALAANGVNTKTHPASRHRAVGRSAHLSDAGARRRLVCGARTPPATATSRSRYRARYKQDPVRTATLAYDAVALIAALVKTQGPQRFSPEILTNPSGFTGIDGLFRFRADGTNERGLAVLRVTPSGRADHRAAAAQLRRAANLHDARRSRRELLHRRTHRLAIYVLITPRDRRRPHRAPEIRPASRAGGRRQSFRSGRVRATRRCGPDRAAGRRSPRSVRMSMPSASRRPISKNSSAVSSRVSTSSVTRPWPRALDLREPSFRAFFRRGGVAVAVDVEPAVGAGPDAGIFVRPPIDEIVPAFAAGPRMIGNLVGGQAVRGADLLRHVVESARGVLVRRFAVCRPHGAPRTASPARS